MEDENEKCRKITHEQNKKKDRKSNERENFCLEKCQLVCATDNGVSSDERHSMIFPMRQKRETIMWNLNDIDRRENNT